MKERLTDGELRDIERRYLRDGVCPLSPEHVWLMAYEIITRRAADREISAYDAGYVAADTKPAPIEQGTLRDEMAMRALAAVIATPDLMGAKSASLRCVEADTQTAYRYADAMLAQRAKETEKP